MKKILLMLFAGVAIANAQPTNPVVSGLVSVTVNVSGDLVKPTNFFKENSNLLNQAVSYRAIENTNVIQGVIQPDGVTTTSSTNSHGVVTLSAIATGGGGTNFDSVNVTNRLTFGAPGYFSGGITYDVLREPTYHSDHDLLRIYMKNWPNYGGIQIGNASTTNAPDWFWTLTETALTGWYGNTNKAYFISIEEGMHLYNSSGAETMSFNPSDGFFNSYGNGFFQGNLEADGNLLIMGDAEVGNLSANGSFSGHQIYGTDAQVATLQVNNTPFVPYKTYVALLEQIGTTAPTATIITNTLGAAITWSRNDVGDYTATIGSGASFPANKTFTTITGPSDDYGGGYFALGRTSTNTVRAIYTEGVGGGIQVPVEIRVYP